MRIKKVINNEIEKNVPNISDNIIKSVDWQEIKQNNMEKTIAQKKLPIFVLSLAFCMVFICSFVIIPIVNFNQHNINSYFITFNINPSVRLVADKNDVITKQFGLNNDGVILLYKKNLVGMKSEQACKVIMDELYNSGFKNNAVKIKVKDDKGNVYQEKQDNIIFSLQSYVQNLGGLNISELDENKLEELDNYYEENLHITEFEENLILEFKNKIIILTQNKIVAFENFIDSLLPFSASEETIITDKNFIDSVKEFCKNNKIENEFDEEITKLDILELKTDLNDIVLDFRDILEDLQNGGDEDDYAEILDDLFDSAKDLLYEEY